MLCLLLLCFVGGLRRLQKVLPTVDAKRKREKEEKRDSLEGDVPPSRFSPFPACLVAVNECLYAGAAGKGGAKVFEPEKKGPPSLLLPSSQSVP